MQDASQSFLQRPEGQQSQGRPFRGWQKEKEEKEILSFQLHSGPKSINNGIEFGQFLGLAKPNYTLGLASGHPYTSLMAGLGVAATSRDYKLFND
jgi:hypothetical protein